MQCSILFYFCHKVAKAEGEGIAINETNFLDKVFREYVHSKFDSNGDNFLSKSELEQVIDILVSPQPLYGDQDSVNFKGDIESLKGIEYFPNLEKLDCSHNKLSVLDVSQNTNLIWLSCHSNQLYNIDLSQNKEFAVLECYGNHFSVLDLSNNENLYALISGNEELSKIQFNIKAYDKEQLLQASQLHYYYTLYGNFESSGLQDLQNIISTPMSGSYAKDSILKVIDPAKPATYKVKGKEFTITYVDTSA